jgi:hypothetical protein
VPRTPAARTAAALAAVLAAAILLPLGARAVSSRWSGDSLWSNALRSLGGADVPFDLAVFLQAAEDVRAGESPYVDPDTVGEGASTPYVYPPLLAVVLVPASALPEEVAGSSPVAVLGSLALVGCLVGSLLALGVRDWRCYPVVLLYPPTLENVEYGAIGPVLALLVALGWRHRDRLAAVAGAIGTAVVLKVFLWPIVIWLAVTRRWRAALGAAGVAAGLALLSWAVIGFRGLADYPALLRSLSDLEAEESYSAFALLTTAGLPTLAARSLVVAASAALLVLAWRAAHGAATDPERDRRSLTFALAAGFVLTPILWLHYLVLLVVPIGLARPRLSALWLLPLTLTVFEFFDWYRGWPRGDAKALVSVALVVGLVFAACLRSEERPDEAPRGAPARA